jgi:hypothetical protein
MECVKQKAVKTLMPSWTLQNINLGKTQLSSAILMLQHNTHAMPCHAITISHNNNNATELLHVFGLHIVA